LALLALLALFLLALGFACPFGPVFYYACPFGFRACPFGFFFWLWASPVLLVPSSITPVLLASGLASSACPFGFFLPPVLLAFGFQQHDESGYKIHGEPPCSK
jgi:hypothetical protein